MTLPRRGRHRMAVGRRPARATIHHIMWCLYYAGSHPVIFGHGAREFCGTVGRTYESLAYSEAYDAGRELAHMLTRRRWENQ